MASVRRVEQFFQTVIANGNIRRDKRESPGIDTLNDHKILIAVKRQLLCLNAVYSGNRRAFVLDGLKKFIKRFSFSLDDDAIGCIFYMPLEIKTICEIINKRPEAHTLNNAFNRYEYAIHLDNSGVGLT
jgi:hypothetical protein